MRPATLLVLLLSAFSGCGKLSLTTAETPVSVTFKPTTADVACPEGYTCVDALEISGKLASMTFVVGYPASEETYTLPILGSDYPISVTGTSDAIDFSLAGSPTFLGNIYCCEGKAYPADDQATVSRIDFLFQYLDYTFSFSNAAGDLGTQTIRLLLTEVPSLGHNRGDRMARNAETGEFLSCNASGCIHKIRQSDADGYRHKQASEFDFRAQVNKTVIGLSANVTTPFSIREEELMETSWAFEIPLPLKNAVMFDNASLVDGDGKLLITDVLSLALRVQANGQPWIGNWTTDVTVTRTPR